MLWVNRLYIFFVGIILAVTTGFGVAAFYPEPKLPQYPIASTPQNCYVDKTADCQKYFDEEKGNRAQYDTDMETYKNASAGYTRTAIFFGIAIGAIFAIVGLVIIKKSHLIANSLLLAGVLTAIFTRFLISLSSLGISATGTEQTNTLGFVQFIILCALSVVVVFVGLFTLKEAPALQR